MYNLSMPKNLEKTASKGIFVALILIFWMGAGCIDDQGDRNLDSLGSANVNNENTDKEPVDQPVAQPDAEPAVESGTDNLGEETPPPPPPPTPSPPPMPAPRAELARIAQSPIRHEKYFRGERELFGYNPLFTPNVVSFGLDNRPYIRTGGTLQILEDDGTWTTVDLIGQAKGNLAGSAISWQPDTTVLGGRLGLFRTGWLCDERVVADRDGDLYTIIESDFSTLKRKLIIHSRDGGHHWRPYVLVPENDKLMGLIAKMEFSDGHNNIPSGPPIILFHPVESPETGPNPLYMLAPKKDAAGGITEIGNTDLKTITTDLSQISGQTQPNSAVTKSGKTYIVYTTRLPRTNGTPTYIVTYTHSTRTISAPVYLGHADSVGENLPNPHNVPAITMDSHRTLHVILGAHGKNFKYTRSLLPNSITGGWTTPLNIGESTTTSGLVRNDEYTYVALVCDSHDTLHVVARYSGIRYIFDLVYMRKRAGSDSWDTFSYNDRTYEPTGTWVGRLQHKTLVHPFKRFYSNWYHKLSIDRSGGRLFVSYMYYADNLFPDEVNAYMKKWPEDHITKQNITCPDSTLNYCAYDGLKAHDPAILMSEDGGNTWRLATTQDFLDGIIN